MALPTDPSQDPTYLAYLRALGYSEEEARAQTAQRTGQLARQLQNQLPVYQDQLDSGLRQISGDAEANGVRRSGKTLFDQQQFATGVQRTRANFEQDIADQQSQAESDLARQIAQLRQQQAEKALDTRSQLSIDNANAGIF